MERIHERYYLSYPRALIKEPMLYQLVKKFDLVFNIRGASVSEEMGLVAVEFEGIERSDRTRARVAAANRRHGRADRKERDRIGARPGAGRASNPARCVRLMILTDTQIERYSRQIIVPGVGGRAQERLLASRVAIVAAPADASGAVAYLAGAGVGRIVVHPVGDGAPYRAMVERIGDLNPDVSVEIASDEMPEQCDLMLALIGDAPAAEAAARVTREHRCAAADRCAA